MLRDGPTGNCLIRWSRWSMFDITGTLFFCLIYLQLLTFQSLLLLSIIVDGCIDTKANVLIREHLRQPQTLYLVLVIISAQLINDFNVHFKLWLHWIGISPQLRRYAMVIL
jgi:hypothetical protein